MAEFIKVKIKWFPMVSALKSPNTFKKKLEKNYEIAGRRVGLKLAALMRRKIRKGVMPPNSGMTTDMKGSSKPLVDEGRLFKAVAFISSASVKGPSVTIGVFRTAKEANVARIVSIGATIVVTPKMSRMFKALHAASTGRSMTLKSERANELLAKSKGTIPPLRVGTTLVIPPRSFALAVLKDPLTATIVEKEFSEALIKTLEELAK